MSEENRKYGIIGTTVFHIILLLILIFFGLKTLPKGEEGILVNFGDTVMGQGTVEPKESVAPKTEKATPPPPVESKPAPVEPEPVKEEIKTQDFDDAPVVKTEAEKKKEREEKERIERERKEQEEQERIQKEKEERERQEQIERQRKLDEERKKKEEQDRQATEARNKVLGAFSGKGSGESTSEGDTGGSGNQGSATGDPNSRNRNGSGLGNSGSGFDLTGRNLVGGLPKPSYNIQEEGIVVVAITVDKNGVVVSAELELKGTTTMNNELRKSAIDAAKKAKFNVAKEAAAYQKGTITYQFVLD